MNPDKKLKADFKKKASKDPDSYYATSVLKEHGFKRKHCSCGTYFWTVTDQEVCGDPACSGGFRFIGDTPAKKKLDYIGVWKEFSKQFEQAGYTPIKRYPVTARWRKDTEFVQASIYDFQPYVVSGEVEPPANPLVVPQLCLRFNDVDNIGITGAHYSCFTMIGQHAFMKPADWNQAQYFKDIYNWLSKGLGLPDNEITFHEDAWAGGGNFGPCMEYFSRGLELGNQVYMMYEVTPSGNKELNLKVLDMGMGHERNAWFTNATSTSYETTFPTVVEKLRKVTGLKTDDTLMNKFLPYASYLNVDEVDDINKTWQTVAEKVGVDVKTLKPFISESAALYSLAEHSRSLLVALSDGALPSNVGGGYNLRVLYRRALTLMDKFNWNVDFNSLCEEHAHYLKPLFPELNQNLKEVQEILDVEHKKYRATKSKSEQAIKKLIEKDISEKDLYTLYDSQGIAPELVKEAAAKHGKEIEVPDNFYSKVTELHEQADQQHQTKREEKLDLEGVQDTEALYYDDYLRLENKSEVLKIIDNNVILKQTVAYPTSGGQVHDKGTINDQEIIDVFKQGSIIVHVLKEKPSFNQGDEVRVFISKERREQLAQHHTATHIVGVACRKVLGNHINQAGAKKTESKATLDITHYASLTDEQIKAIETEANTIVNKKTPIKKSFYPRTEAETTFGMGIYQGGAVPGKTLRIVQIENLDVQACGGTHLDNTSQTGPIKILKSTKISDSIVRIEYTAGAAAQSHSAGQEDILNQVAELLGVEINQLPGRVDELFNSWKKAKKAAKKGKEILEADIELKSTDVFEGEVLPELAKLLKTQNEHIHKTVKRFLDELEEHKK